MHNETLSVSVVVCAYTEKRWDDLLGAVASLRNQILQPREIILVIDHNPTLLERVRTHLTGIVLVENIEVRGLSGARNSGIAVAQGDIVAFMDEDAIAAPDWLERLLILYTDTQVLGVGGAIEPIWVSNHPRWLPEEFNWVVGCSYRGMPETTTHVRNLIGCNMPFRREVFQIVGGFRIGRVGALSIGQENDETEFCIRLTTHCPSALLLHHPSAVVQHRVPTSRTKLKYFMKRCFSEGISKARLSMLVGHDKSLSSEQTYVLRTLPAGVIRGFAVSLLHRDLTGILRAGAIIAGLAITTIGYLIGRTPVQFVIRQELTSANRNC